MDFIGRTIELEALNRHYASGRFELCVMYGRRRVGKTTLINRFVSDKPTIFFSALQASAQENLEFLSAAVMRAIPGGAVGAIFSSFDDAFNKVFELAQEERLVLVIDEFPYLVESYPTVSSLLQHQIDKNKDNSQAFLILNGSSMTQMQDEFFTNNRPLYGRKTFQIKVKPFGFFGMRDNFTRSPSATLPYIYAAYGGTPKYFEYYDEGQSFEENIMADFLSIDSPLLEETETILKKEVREPPVYNTLFAAIAQGVHKYSELSSKSKLESGNISRYLENLILLDLVRRDIPAYTKDQKKSLYRIDDNMFRFWYRFVARNLSLINHNYPDLAFHQIASGLEQYMGGVFEEICLEHLWRKNGSTNLPFTFAEAGRWWGSDPERKKEVEIDILAHSDSRQGLFCECKWSSNQVGENVLEELLHKAELPQFAGLSDKHVALFSKNGFTAGCQKAAASLGNVVLIPLQNILDS